MKMIKMMGLLFSLLYIGCGDSEQNSLESMKNKNKKSDINVTTILHNKEILSRLGFDINNQKISIDMNKTTDFFKQMEKEMQAKADEFQHKIEKADINLTRDIGIDLSGEKLEIDFNKAKKMFQQINILMKEVLLDKNSSKY